MKITCIIADDEPFARDGIKSYIEKIKFLSLIGECEDAIQLNSVLKDKQPDLIFLDIEMPGMTGIELLSNISNPPKVIIVSAHGKYAVKSYEFDVVDYLLKPVSFERFLKSTDKVFNLLKKERENGADYIFIKSNKQLKKIFFKDIVLIESMENYVVVYTASSREVVYASLKQIRNTLPEETFLQTHRSYIVNIEYIKTIDGNLLDVTLQKIPVARNFRDQVFNTILNNRLVNKK